MASSSGMTLNEPIIPLMPTFDEEDLTMVTLSNTWTNAAGDTVKKKMEVPKITTDDVELILRAYQEFTQVAQVANLNFAATPTKLFSNFRQMMAANIRDDWDLASAGHPNTQAGFRAAVTAFFGRFLEPTDLADQRRYLDTTKKPYKLSVHQLGSRLRFINRLMAFFPGAGGVAPYDDLALKTVFYNLMLDDWKIAYMSSGRDFSDPNTTFLSSKQHKPGH